MMRLDYTGHRSLRGTAELPGSKSISQRLLMIHALCNNAFTTERLSDAEDAQILRKGLEQNSGTIYCADGGTPLRFLLAYHALKGNPVTLDGSERLRQRPLREMLIALESMGAQFEYLNRKHCIPLRIQQGIRHFDDVHIDAGKSSQFVSALMLIASEFPGEKYLYLNNDPVSFSYLKLTAEIMHCFGINISFHADKIIIHEGSYHSETAVAECESDWGSAQYFYLAAALSREAEIYLPGLKSNSAQPDAQVAGFLKPYIQTEYLNEGVKIHSLRNETNIFPDSFDCLNCPDLAPALVVLAAMKHSTCRFTGLETLSQKESDRTAVLRENLAQWNIRFDPQGDTWMLNATQANFREAVIQTHGDHRMAMAFAAASLQVPVTIDNEACVKKSFPGFFEQLDQLICQESKN